LVAGDTIYDATGFLHTHPGGVESILRKAGGASDCTRDFEFHSKGARKLLNNSIVGKLRPCPGDSFSPAAKEVKEWWVFW
jgi:cytochrome b involved in lipid metabolism